VKFDALWRVSLETTAEAEEAIAALFESLFAQTPSIYTDAESGRTTCTVFVPKKPGRLELDRELGGGLLRIRECGLNPGLGQIRITRVAKQDWSESWKRHFKPFSVGLRLLVKPSWSRRRARTGGKVVVIDPGLSFGTGQHPTTRFCLEQLVKARKRQEKQSFLDVGTGSGILAIGAAKLGYNPVEAFDVDPAAVRVAAGNARKNRVRIRITQSDIRKVARGAKVYDLVCANLTADLLESCSRKLGMLVKPAGPLVLAGILRTQAASVRTCFEKLGFRTELQQANGEWESLLLRSKGH
jgi:ribosomal protein L11 methyltransferase